MLATNAPRSEQAAVDAAAEQGIPTLAMLDLFGLPGARIDLMALTTARRAAVLAGERPLGYADFLHLVDAGAALAHGRRLAPDNTRPDVPEAETLAYLGINWLDWEARHGATQAARL